ncbi:MAG TPA: sugar ABC transporter permease [Micrococcales bacterium]|uniref:Sugar ABC transporter permease n=1 Tax=Miniimonas arenae TaxID=676201 RepID=A0A5C5BD13_9MICO|nr:MULTISPECIES: sugar ABC transporter permease [Miniimonas]TNU73897.1 sugar ABC transporter permease [Miniimonas arenae]HCX84430.1 sugar ABC transporter permease [Micrococcales bacterium]
MSSVVAERPGQVRKVRRRLTGLWFTVPFLLVFVFVFIAPLAYTIWLSLFQTKLIGGTSFVGADNFVAVFQDPKFWEGLGRVSLFLLVQVPVMLAMALVAALVIDSARLHGIRFFRIAMFLPYAVPSVAAVLMWGFMYGERFGLVGNLNGWLGTDFSVLSQQWLLVGIGNIVTWSFMGYNMLILYSSLKAISPELYEAAALDGAGQLRIVRNIKLPAVQGSIVVAVIFSIIGSFQLFNEPNIMQKLVPNLISTYYTPNMYAYNLSFTGQQVNYAAALAIIMGVVTAVIAYVVQLRGNREALK